MRVIWEGRATLDGEAWKRRGVEWISCLSLEFRVDVSPGRLEYPDEDDGLIAGEISPGKGRTRVVDKVIPPREGLLLDGELVIVGMEAVEDVVLSFL
jgi:hypothetical protein